MPARRATLNLNPSSSPKIILPKQSAAQYAAALKEMNKLEWDIMAPTRTRMVIPLP